MSLLEVRNICKHFGDHEVLKGVDVDLERGDVMAIIGSSGNGKTTLLRCLNFLEMADEGTISVDGEIIFDASESYSENDLWEKRRKMGMVFQAYNLFPQYTVERNLTLAAELHAKDEYRKVKKFGKLPKEKLEEIRTRAAELLETVGLSDKAKSYPCELSGGQCQRVAIARALMLSPEILCFDEPTSALDPELTIEVLKTIRSLKDQGHTMIIVTHEMNFAKNVADKIIFLREGVIEVEGTPEEVFEKSENAYLRQFLTAGDEVN